MRIGFDAKRLFNNFTGLGNYSRSLVEALQTHFPENSYHLYSTKVKENEETTPFLQSPYSPFIYQKAFKNYWRTKGIIQQLKADGITIYHGLSHEIPVGIQNINIKSVVTIHDLIMDILPQTYSFFDRKIYQKKFRYSCQHADKIIAISESTKQDIVNYYGINPDKISVIYQCCHPIYYKDASKEVLESTQKKYQLPHEFILSVGSVIERKNLLNVVKAYDLLAKDQQLPLVIVGKGKEYKEKVIHQINQQGLEQKVIWLENVSSLEELQAIYTLANIMIYPSHYEGFGLPVTEALLSGTPVITSNRSSLPEAGGSAAITVNPESSEEIAQAINTILSSDNTQRIEEGKKHAQTFNATNMVQQVNQLYQNLLG